MHHPTDRIAHTTTFVTPVVKHWLEIEIVQWVHHHTLPYNLKINCVENITIELLPQCEHCQCILTIRHILVESNHLAQTKMEELGRRNVVESFEFHLKLVLSFLKECNFIINFKLRYL